MILFNNNNNIIMNFLVIAGMLMIMMIGRHNTGSSTVVNAASTETLIGVVGKDFIMLGADTGIARSIVLTSTEVDKIKPIIVTTNHNNARNNNVVVMAGSGELADVEDIYQILRKHAILSELETNIPTTSGGGGGVKFVDMKRGEEEDAGSPGTTEIPEPWTTLSVSALARLARHEIAQRLRSRAPYQGLGLLIAGMEKQDLHRRYHQQGSHTKILCKSGITGSSIPFAEQVRKQLDTVVTKSSSESDSSASSSSLTTTTAKEEEEERQEQSQSQSSSLIRPCLFWLDEYGSIQKVRYGFVGMGSNFGLAILDQGYQPDLSRKQAATLIQNCFHQLQSRYLINSQPNNKPPIIKCIDSNGCHKYIC